MLLLLSGFVAGIILSTVVKDLYSKVKARLTKTTSDIPSPPTPPASSV